jgi:hypothetical protein
LQNYEQPIAGYIRGLGTETALEGIRGCHHAVILPGASPLPSGT